MKSRSASHVALAFVIIVVGGSFFWWFRARPSYLLYRAHKGLGGENQAAAIAEYSQLLSRPDLSRGDEIRYRKALGEIYVRAVQESDGLSSFTLTDRDKPLNPFLAKAKTEFERVLKLDPNDAEAHDYLGRILWTQNLENFAMTEFEAARAKEPNNPEPLRYLSMIHEQRGEAAEARELALQALGVAPGNDEARMALIAAYGSLGNDAAALDEFSRLSPAYLDQPSVRAKHALALAKENYWDEARAEIEAAMQTAPNDGWIRITFGRMLMDRGLDDEAAGAFAQAMQLLPRNAWPLVWHALIEQRRGDCEEPVRTAQMLTDAFPRWPTARLVSAAAQLCNGQDVKAVDELDEALRLSRTFPDAARMKADILLDRGQFDELGRAVRPMLDEKILEADANILLSRSFLLQGNADMAIEMAESAIHFDQRNQRAQAALGLARAAAGDADGAERALSDAVALNPADAYVAAADAYVRALRLPATDGDAMFRDITSRAPREPYAWLLWGDLSARQKRFSDAIQQYQTAVSLRPWLLRAHLGLVASNWALKHYDRAAQALADASSVNSRHPDVISWRDRIRGHV